MGEYAYDFTGENVHDGPSRNPHDVDAHDRRLVGRLRRRGRGRPRAAVARLRHQRLDPRAVVVLRTVRPETDLRPPAAHAARFRSCSRSIISDRWRGRPRDLALSYDAMQGFDAGDGACVDRPIEPVTPQLGNGIGGLRIAVAGGYFRKGLCARRRRGGRAGGKGARRNAGRSNCPRSRGRAPRPTSSPRPRAARCTLPRLRTRPQDFDPATRDRLIAGAMIPAPLVDKAQKFRRWYRARMLELFRDGRCDHRTGNALRRAETRRADADARRRRDAAARQHRHLHPTDFVHRPAVAAVPVPLSPLPIGVQIIAAPWREDIVLRIAQYLADSGVAAAPVPANG